MGISSSSPHNRRSPSMSALTASAIIHSLVCRRAVLCSRVFVLTRRVKVTRDGVKCRHVSKNWLAVAFCFTHSRLLNCWVNVLLFFRVNNCSTFYSKFLSRMLLLPKLRVYEWRRCPRCTCPSEEVEN